MHRLDYDLAEAMHTGCALLRSDGSIHREAVKHGFDMCPNKLPGLAQARIVLKRLSTNGHVFTVEDIDGALKRAIPALFDDQHAGGAWYADAIWKALHARS